MDYSKLNARFSDYGLSLAHDPITLPFGKYEVSTNTDVNYEGQITARPGLLALSSEAVSGATSINGVRRLNDSVRGFSTYVVRTGTKLDVTINTSTTHVTTTNPFGFTSNHGGYVHTGMNAAYGSICVDRTTLSNQVWAYVGDATSMVKVGINSSQGIDVKTIGIARPTGPPTMVQTTGGSLTLLGTYYYRYTLYDSNTGVESLFNSVDDTVGITLTSSNNQINVTIPSETVNTAVDNVRIYRLGGTLSTWLFVAQVAYTGTTITYDDTTADIGITGGTVLDTVSDQPYTCTNSSGVDVAGVSLPYIFGPINGYQLAVGDPNNTGYLYWANKFNPDSQNPANRVEVTSPQDPLQNGCVFNGKAYVFTREALYYMVLGLGTSTWTPFKTSCGHGLVAPHAFCVGPEIYFLSKDGVYATSGGSERSLTTDDIRPLFLGETAAGYSPIDYTNTTVMNMVYNNNKLRLEYAGQDGSIYTLVYELIYQRWRIYRYRIASGCLYDDEEGTTVRLLLGGANGLLYLSSGTQDAGGSPTDIDFELTTGIITLNAPLIHKEWGALIFDINPNSVSVTVTVYTLKGTFSIANATWNDSGRSRKVLNLADTFAEDIQIDIRWSTSAAPPILYGYEILYKPDVVQLTRWSATGVNHGIQGWQILRSGYITLISDGTTTLSITPDGGTTYNYTIPTTSGVKQKVFIPFDPIKGKLFTYVLALGTATYFRLYNDDCEINVKPWISSFGYARVNPFTGGGGSTPIGGDSGAITAGPGVNALPGGGGNSNIGAELSGLLDGASSQFSFTGAGGVPIVPGSTTSQATTAVGNPTQSATVTQPGSPGEGTSGSGNQNQALL